MAGILIRDKPTFLESIKVLIVSGGIFFCLLPFWKTQYSMYFYTFYVFPTHTTFYGDLYATLMRWILGITGSVFFLTLIKRCTKNIFDKYGVISTLGSLTLGIYLIQERAIQRTTFIIDCLKHYVPDNLAYTLYSVIALGVLSVLVYGLSKIKHCKKYLLGMKL